MRGCRPLTKDEIVNVSEQFTGTYEVRNRALFIIGVNTGGRISELLSLKIDDVWQNDRPVTDLLFERAIVKGGEISRMIPVNKDCREAITELIEWHKHEFGDLEERRPLFTSRKHDQGKLQAISRTTGHRILCVAFRLAGLNGKLATHSMRKTFAQNIYERTGDILLVKELLGHKNVSTTQQYLGASYKKMRKAVEAIALDNNTFDLLLHSLSEVSTEKLLVELQTRGIDMTSAIDQLRAERENVKLCESHTRHKAKVITIYDTQTVEKVA